MKKGALWAFLCTQMVTSIVVAAYVLLFGHGCACMSPGALQPHNFNYGPDSCYRVVHPENELQPLNFMYRTFPYLRATRPTRAGLGSA